MDPLLLQIIREMRTDIKELNSKMDLVINQRAYSKGKMVGAMFVVSALVMWGFRIVDLFLK